MSEHIKTGEKVVLTFTLKDKYFKMYQRGKKREEFRQVTEYWSRRVPKLKEGDIVRLQRGYTNEFILAVVKQWVMIPTEMLPLYFRVLYGKAIMWYRIDLSLLSQEEKE